MPVTIRLRRMGKKKQPYYRLSVVDSRVKRDGRFIETVGRYVPTTTPETVELNEERVFYWLHHGASLSETVRSLLRRQGLMQRWHEMSPEDKAAVAGAGRKSRSAAGTEAKRPSAEEAAAASGEEAASGAGAEPASGGEAESS